MKLRKIQRQNVAQVRQYVEIRATKISRGIREVGVQGLKGLVQVTDLMIPQVVCVRADVADLCHPVLRELVLDPQIPLEDPRHATDRAGSAHDSRGVIGISEWNG